MMGQKRIASLLRELSEKYNEFNQLNQEIADILDSLQAEYLARELESSAIGLVLADLERDSGLGFG